MIIKVYDDEGNLIREGKPRLDEPKNDRKIFGFRLPELWLLATFTFGVGLNWAAFIELKESNKWLMGFAKNSDSYHTAVLGVRFEQGMPANPSYDVTSTRNKSSLYTGESK